MLNVGGAVRRKDIRKVAIRSRYDQNVLCINIEVLQRNVFKEAYTGP